MFVPRKNDNTAWFSACQNKSPERKQGEWLWKRSEMPAADSEPNLNDMQSTNAGWFIKGNWLKGLRYSAYKWFQWGLLQ